MIFVWVIIGLIKKKSFLKCLCDVRCIVIKIMCMYLIICVGIIVLLLNEYFIILIDCMYNM